MRSAPRLCYQLLAPALEYYTAYLSRAAFQARKIFAPRPAFWLATMASCTFSSSYARPAGHTSLSNVDPWSIDSIIAVSSNSLASIKAWLQQGRAPAFNFSRAESKQIPA